MKHQVYCTAGSVADQLLAGEANDADANYERGQALIHVEALGALDFAEEESRSGKDRDRSESLEHSGAGGSNGTKQAKVGYAVQKSGQHETGKAEDHEGNVGAMSIHGKSHQYIPVWHRVRKDIGKAQAKGDAADETAKLFGRMAGSLGKDGLVEHIHAGKEEGPQKRQHGSEHHIGVL